MTPKLFRTRGLLVGATLLAVALWGVPARANGEAAPLSAAASQQARFQQAFFANQQGADAVAYWLDSYLTEVSAALHVLAQQLPGDPARVRGVVRSPLEGPLPVTWTPAGSANLPADLSAAAHQHGLALALVGKGSSEQMVVAVPAGGGMLSVGIAPDHLIAALGGGWKGGRSLFALDPAGQVFAVTSTSPAHLQIIGQLGADAPQTIITATSIVSTERLATANLVVAVETPLELANTGATLNLPAPDPVVPRWTPLPAEGSASGQPSRPGGLAGLLASALARLGAFLAGLFTRRSPLALCCLAAPVLILPAAAYTRRRRDRLELDPPTSPELAADSPVSLPALPMPSAAAPPSARPVAEDDTLRTLRELAERALAEGTEARRRIERERLAWRDERVHILAQTRQELRQEQDGLFERLQNQLGDGMLDVRLEVRDATGAMDRALDQLRTEMAENLRTRTQLMEELSTQTEALLSAERERTDRTLGAFREDISRELDLQLGLLLGEGDRLQQAIRDEVEARLQTEAEARERVEAELESVVHLVGRLQASLQDREERTSHEQVLFREQLLKLSHGLRRLQAGGRPFQPRDEAARLRPLEATR